MVKHWPGGGSGEAGRDARLGFGKYAVFPGENLDTNIFVFNHGAFKLDGPTKQASAVMPYYTISYAQDPSGKNVANAFSKYIIQDLLYDTYKYKGVVCTDWSITRDYADVHIHGGKPWGVEGLSVEERHYEVIKAGCDQFGGNDEKGPVIAAYNMWVRDFGEESARARFEHSAKKLLLNFFRTGLFENPYLDPAETAQIVGNKESREHGYLAQLKSVVMLKNHDKTLPLSNKPKVYIPKRQIPNVYNLAGKVTVAGSYDYPIDPAIVTDYYQMTTPDEADFAIVVIGEPVNGRGFDTEDIKKGGNGYVPMSLQYGDYKAVHARKESIAAGDPKETTNNRSYRGKTIKTENAGDIDLIIETRKAIGKDKPLIVILPCSKPVIMKEFEKYADAILISFGVQPQAYLDIISGKFEPSGLLPIQFPSDMKTVEQQYEDTPRDMKCYKDADGNVYDFAFGMNWSGVINDERVEKYR
jgi:beta-glucosidase